MTMNQQQHQPCLTLRDQAHFYAFNSGSYMTEPNYGNTRDGVFEMEAPNDMYVHHDLCSARIENMIMNSFESVRQECEVCRGGHHVIECPFVNQVDGVTFDHYHAYNPYPVGSTSSNSYNPAWQSPQDCSWSNYHQPISDMYQNPQYPEFQDNSFQQVHDQQIPQYQPSYIEELLENYIMESQRQEEVQPVLNQPILIPQESRLEEVFENFLLEHQQHEEVMEQQMQRLATEIEQMRANNTMLEHQISQQVAEYNDFPSQPKAILEEEVQLFAMPWKCGEQMEAQLGESALEPDDREERSSQVEEEAERDKLYVPPPSDQPQLPFPQRVQEEKIGNPFLATTEAIHGTQNERLTLEKETIEFNPLPMESDHDDSCLETNMDARVIMEELHGNQFSNAKDGCKVDKDPHQQEEPQSPMLLDTNPTPLFIHLHRSASVYVYILVSICYSLFEQLSLSKERAAHIKFKPLYSQIQKFCVVPGSFENTTKWALQFCKPDLKAAADKRHLRLNE